MGERSRVPVETISACASSVSPPGPLATPPARGQLACPDAGIIASRRLRCIPHSRRRRDAAPASVLGNRGGHASTGVGTPHGESGPNRLAARGSASSPRPPAARPRATGTRRTGCGRLACGAGGGGARTSTRGACSPTSREARRHGKKALSAGTLNFSILHRRLAWAAGGVVDPGDMHHTTGHKQIPETFEYQLVRSLRFIECLSPAADAGRHGVWWPGGVRTATCDSASDEPRVTRRRRAAEATWGRSPDHRS